MSEAEKVTVLRGALEEIRCLTMFNPDLEVRPNSLIWMPDFDPSGRALGRECKRDWARIQAAASDALRRTDK